MLEERLKTLETELVAVEAEWEANRETGEQLFKRRGSLMEEVASLRSRIACPPNEPFSLERVMELSWPEDFSRELKSRLGDWISTNIKYHTLGQFSHLVSKQIALSLAFTRSNAVDPQIEEFMQIARLVKPEPLPKAVLGDYKNFQSVIPDKTAKVFPITERTRGNAGFYYLIVGKVTSYVILLGNDVLVLYKSDSLDACLNYIHQNVYYRKKRRS